MAAGLLLNSTVDKGREQVVRKAMQEKLDRQEKLAVQLEKQLETLRQRQELEETQLRAQAATMQQERDQALARAEEESKLRVRREQQVDEIRNQIKATEARIKAEAKKAVQKEKLKQKAIAKQTSVLENELNDQRKKLYNMVNELERTRQEAEQAAKKAAKQAVVVQAPVAVEDPSSTNDSASVKARSDSRKNNRPAEFASDPCEGPQARFLSTCR
jgi:chromosome segregation ATPase